MGSDPINRVRPHYANSAEPVLPHHHHGGGVEFAVAHELAADGAACCLVAGGEAVAEVLVGAHGAGAVLDDVEVVEPCPAAFS